MVSDFVPDLAVCIYLFLKHFSRPLEEAGVPTGDDVDFAVTAAGAESGVADFEVPEDSPLEICAGGGGGGHAVCDVREGACSPSVSVDGIERRVRLSSVVPASCWKCDEATSIFDAVFDSVVSNGTSIRCLVKK